MDNRSLAKEWEEFCKFFRGKLTSEELRSARRCFYGGAACMYRHIMLSLSPGDDVQDRDLQMMRNVDTELKEFAAKVKANKD